MINALIPFSPNFIIEGYFPVLPIGIKLGPVVEYGKIEVLFFTLNILVLIISGLYYLYKKKNKKSGITAL